MPACALSLPVFPVRPGVPLAPHLALPQSPAAWQTSGHSDGGVRDGGLAAARPPAACSPPDRAHAGARVRPKASVYLGVLLAAPALPTYNYLQPPSPAPAGVSRGAADGLGAPKDHGCWCQRAPAAAQGSAPARPLLLAFSTQRPRLSPYHGLGAWGPSRGSWIPAAKPAGRGRGCIPEPLQPPSPGLAWWSAASLRKALAPQQPTGETEAQSCKGHAPLGWGWQGQTLSDATSLLPHAPWLGFVPSPHQDPAPPAPYAVLCPSQDPGVLREGERQRCWLGPHRGSPLLPGARRRGSHRPSDYVQPTNKYPWEGGARVSACVCAWMYIYIYIFIYL